MKIPFTTLILATCLLSARADWLIKTYRNGSQVTTFAEADALIASSSPIAVGTASRADLLGFSTGEGTGHFSLNLPVAGLPQNQPTDDYAVRGTGYFNVQQSGNYTFGLHTDDGARLRIDGNTIITDDSIHPPRDSVYVAIPLSAGLHFVEWTWWNHYGGAEAEVLVAPGSYSGFNGNFNTMVVDGLAIPFPPQKIFLAFGQPCDFGLIVPTAFGKSWPVVNPFGSIPAATVSTTYRNNVTSQIKDIFDRSGVHNIEWTAADSNDAIAVFFCSTVNGDLLGYSKGVPDRFNSKRRGEVVVFASEVSPNLDAETAAHEIGHALGLRHVDPLASADPSDQEVMDLFPSITPKFVNAVSDVTDITSFSTHNPLYHLLRYVDGWSPEQLQNAAIAPGTWDTGSTVDAKLSFQNANLRLYKITVFASGGSAESSFTVEQIPTATLAELSQRSFSIPAGFGMVLLASSVTNGQPDVITSTGDPFSSTNQIISTTGTNSFSLFRQDSSTNATVLSTATGEFDAQTPYCDISVSAPATLRLDFRGTLQLSTNLTDWTDYATNSTSPQFILIGTNNSVGFFRTRQ